MKRILLRLFVTCLAAAVAAPVASALFELDYNGRLNHRLNSYTGFNLKKSSGNRKVTFFTSRGLPYKCDTGSSGKTGFITLHDSFRVVQGEFDGTSHVFMPQGDPVAHVDGRISNGSAHGTLRISGKLIRRMPRRPVRRAAGAGSPSEPRYPRPRPTLPLAPRARRPARPERPRSRASA